MVGSHAFVWEIPGEDAGTTSVKKFREDCNVHTAAQCCIKTGTLTGVALLDAKIVISLEKADKMMDEAGICLRDVLLANICQYTRRVGNVHTGIHTQGLDGLGGDHPQELV